MRRLLAIVVIQLVLIVQGKHLSAIARIDLSDYEISASNGTLTVADQRTGSGLDGSDTVSNVEVLRFADGDVSTAALTSVSLTGGSVVENAGEGVVVADLSTDLPDDSGRTVTYELITNPGGRFAIQGSQLVVAAGASLDFETSTTQTVSVRATDSWGHTAELDVTITVTDAAEAIQLGDGGVTFVDTDVSELSITGGSGADTITGGSGDDVVDGGAGVDIAVFSGDLSEYEISATNGTLTVADQRVNGDGSDTVANVEVLRFADGDVSTAALTSVSFTGGSVVENVGEGVVVAE
ncbi:MAG: hypothetical protein AAFU68_06130, partial [Pseudomonadota bacterium]